MLVALSAVSTSGSSFPAHSRLITQNMPINVYSIRVSDLMKTLPHREVYGYDYLIGACEAGRIRVFAKRRIQLNVCGNVLLNVKEEMESLAECTQYFIMTTRASRCCFSLREIHKCRYYYSPSSHQYKVELNI